MRAGEGSRFHSEVLLTFSRKGKCPPEIGQLVIVGGKEIREYLSENRLRGARVAVNLDQTRPHADITERTPADLGESMALLVNVVYRGMAEQVAPHELNLLEFALLRAFLDQEEWTTTRLAQLLPVKTPRISRVVTKLVDRGLIRRQRNRNDRRVVFLTLTDKGKALTMDLHRRVQEFDATLIKGVSEEEMSVFTSVTSRVMANYSALARPN